MCSYIHSQIRYCRKWWKPGALAVIMPWAFISLEGRATPLRRSQRASDRLSSWGSAERSNGAERGETCGCSAEVAPIPASLLNCVYSDEPSHSNGIAMVVRCATPLEVRAPWVGNGSTDSLWHWLRCLGLEGCEAFDIANGAPEAPSGPL